MGLVRIQDVRDLLDTLYESMERQTCFKEEYADGVRYAVQHIRTRLNYINTFGKEGMESDVHRYINQNLTRGDGKVVLSKDGSPITERDLVAVAQNFDAIGNSRRPDGTIYESIAEVQDGGMLGLQLPFVGIAAVLLNTGVAKGDKVNVIITK